MVHLLLFLKFNIKYTFIIILVIPADVKLTFISQMARYNTYSVEFVLGYQMECFLFIIFIVVYLTSRAIISVYIRTPPVVS